MAQGCTHEIHVIRDGCEPLHEMTADCDCAPEPEIVSFDDGSETVFYFHNGDDMSDEIQALRELLQKEQAEKTELQSKVKQTTEYLELMHGDHSKTQGEKSIIEMSLQYLRG